MQTSLPWDHFLMQPASVADMLLLCAAGVNTRSLSRKRFSLFQCSPSKKAFFSFFHTRPCVARRVKRQKKMPVCAFVCCVWDAFGCGQHSEQSARPFGVSSGEFPRVTRLCPAGSGQLSLCAQREARLVPVDGISTLLGWRALPWCPLRLGVQMQIRARPHKSKIRMGKGFCNAHSTEQPKHLQIGFSPFLFMGFRRARLIICARWGCWCLLCCCGLDARMVKLSVSHSPFCGLLLTLSVTKAWISLDNCPYSNAERNVAPFLNHVMRDVFHEERWEIHQNCWWLKINIGDALRFTSKRNKGVRKTLNF
jgi:hypothetical protein